MCFGHSPEALLGFGVRVKGLCGCKGRLSWSGLGDPGGQWTSGNLILSCLACGIHDGHILGCGGLPSLGWGWRGYHNGVGCVRRPLHGTRKDAAIPGGICLTATQTAQSGCCPGLLWVCWRSGELQSLCHHAAVMGLLYLGSYKNIWLKYGEI